MRDRALRTSAVIVLVLSMIAVAPVARSQLAGDVGPDRRFAFSDPRKPAEVKWTATGSGVLITGDLGAPFGCASTVHECDDTLLHVLGRGVLDITTSATDAGALDTDLSLYRSNRSGEPLTSLQTSAGASSAEAITARIEAGFYLVRIDYAFGSGSVDAIARFKPVISKPSKQFDYSRVTGLSKRAFKTTRSSLFLPMRDGRNVYLEITRPKAKGRFGVILESSPYHGTLTARDGGRIVPQTTEREERPLGLTGYFVPRGYAVAMMDLRGTGKSQGCLDLMGPRDASDIKTVVEWLARQPWSNGRVGMVGHSYPGSTPMLAAAMRPKGLVTIVPSAGVSQMYEHLFHNGVPWAGTFGGGIAAYNILAMQRALPDVDLPPELFTALPLPIASNNGDNFGNDPQDAPCGLTQSPAFTGESLLSGRRVKWHDDRDWRKRATAWPGSVFLIHGVNDANARITGIEWFYARGGRPQDKAWIGQWDHGSGCCPNRRGTQWTFALHAWFDKHLLKRNVDTGPNVEVFLNSEADDASALDGRTHVLEAGGLPMRTRTLVLNATPDGKLTGKGAAVGAQTFAGTPFDVGSVFFGIGGHAEFVSDPFPGDLVVVGLPELRVARSQTLPRVHSVANLFVRSKDGTDRRISNCAANPELRNGLDTVTPVVPGQRVDLRHQCFTTAHRLRRGDRLVLQVATSDFEHMPFFSVDPRVTVFTGPKATSLHLPVVADPKLTADTVDLNIRPGG